MSKSNTPHQQILPKYGSLQISTVPRGRAVPLIYGTTKITCDMIWAGGFFSVKVTPPAPHVNAGKGFGGGSTPAGTPTFYYFAALMWAVMEGPMTYLTALRNGSTWVFFDGASPPITWPVVSSPGQNDPNLGQTGFEAYPLIQATSGVGTAFNSDYPWTLQSLDRNRLADAEANQMINAQGNISPISNPGYMYDGTHFNHLPNSNAYASQPITLQYGVPFQAPPPYITANFIGQDIPYHYTATIFSYNYQLGQSATPPNLEAWVTGLMPYDYMGVTTGGISIIDSCVTDVIYDLLTDGVHGLGQLPAFIDLFGSWATMKNFCVASGLFVSVVVQGQQQISQIVQQLLTHVIGESW